MEFTHLHVHSHYSLLDGMSKVPDLVDKCQRTGMHAMALTDHGNMYGIKELMDYAKKINKAAKDKVKDQEAKIKNAKEQINKLPELLELQKATTDPHDLEDIKKKIADARKAEKSLPILEDELPALQKKADEYIPFKPIIGVEAYCARRHRKLQDKDYKELTPEGKERIVDRSGWHLILLAKNKKGYQNLCRIVSLSFLEGFYERPRIDKELLEQYHEGLIVCSACLGGELPQLIMQGKTDEAERSAQWFKSIFGEDYYIEIQRHKTDKFMADKNTFVRQEEVNPVLIDIAHRNGIKIICSNDAHFVEEEHAEAHDRLICISTAADFNDPKRMHYTKQEWLKTPEEMAAIFADIPEALENTMEIANKVEVYSIDSKPIMPKFPIPEDFGTEESYRQQFTEEDLFNEFTRNEKGEVILSPEDAQKKIDDLGGYDKLYRIKLEADYLAKLTWEGAHQRYGENLSDHIKEQIIFELHIMKTMGFPGYFLIVMDYIRAAREELDVSVGPGRGSAAGSVVAYCLKITDIDPLKYDLLFERFLNPDRISLPDIDVDFDDEGRGKVLDWVSKKYGTTHVAHIITYGTMAAKSAVADVGRVQQVPLPEVNRIKKLIPDRFDDSIKDAKGKTPKINLPNCLRYVPALKEELNSPNQNISTMLQYASQLEDTIRQVGIHACGVIIGADDLTKFAPLATIKDKKTGNDVIVTEYDGHVIESVGLIKMDFLGLKTLSIIKETQRNIMHSKGETVDIDHISTEDPLTYKLFQEGKTIAVFQFESPGMQKYLKELKPTVLTDLIAMNALYRPGPMEYIPTFIRRKHGLEPVTYDLDCMELYLKDTYGVTVYQEQVMLLSRLIAGFTRGESDNLRKAMGKKIFSMLESLYPKFIEGGKKNGHDPKILNKIWKDWEAFASYAFNKSHAACYAWVAYQTGYLKAHYPAEFMAANLTTEKSDIKVVTKYMDECKALGIKVLEPDVNESEMNFTVNKAGNIRFGLGGIKGLGEVAVQRIIEERERNGKYKDIYDFVERIDLRACNKKAFESLALSGAFDCFPNFYREQLMATNAQGENVIDSLIRYGNKFQDEKNTQMNSLFGDLGMSMAIKKPELPQTERMTAINRLNLEKDYIGMYLSAHPLDEYKFELENLCNITAKELTFFDSIREVTNRAQGEAASRNLQEGEEEEEEVKIDPIEWLQKHEGKMVTFGGIITDNQSLTSKKGNPYGRYRIEDYSGSYTFPLFGDNYTNNGLKLGLNQFVYITGVIQQRFAGARFFQPKPVEQADYEIQILSISPLQDMQKNMLQSITLQVPILSLNEEIINNLHDYTSTKGTVELRLSVYDELRENVLNFLQPATFNVRTALYEYLQELATESAEEENIPMEDEEYSPTLPKTAKSTIKFTVQLKAEA